MYLIILLFTIIVLLLFAMYRTTNETFQAPITFSTDDLNNAKLHNIQYSANIPGINSTDVYELPNKCVKYQSKVSCSNNQNDIEMGCSVPIKPNMNGVCKCAKKNVDMHCDADRANISCEEVCQNAMSPKSYEFNGENSHMEMALNDYDKSNGFTISFYIKMSEFKRYPFKPQNLIYAKDESNNELFLIYINTNRKICAYSYNTKLNYINHKELTNDWYHISFGNKGNTQFLQVNDERKQIRNMNIDNNREYETLNLSVGVAAKTHYPFKGLLGNITISKEFLTKEAICQENKYCSDEDMKPPVEKCIFKPGGNTQIGCIKKCQNDMNINNCSIEKCINKCEGCDDETQCDWLKETTVLSNINQPAQKVVEDAKKCLFEAWGLTPTHCTDECVSGKNKSKYGGDLCDKSSCEKICKSCENIRYCPWLVPGKSKAIPLPPNPPKNFVGIPVEGAVLLSWSRPNSNGSEITKYKVLYYKADNPNDGLFMRVLDVTGTKNKGSELKHTVTELDNITYNFTVIAINANGASKIAKIISIKPNTVEGFQTNTVEGFQTNTVEGFQTNTVEGFQTNNPRNFINSIINTNNELLEKEENEGCNLFNSLRGKQIEISF